ncbi:MAG: hypothetical protein F6K37_23320 [Moorea sp. SIO4E2]|nr:hypothetical protein [Moorena sp. SIO4E2]
MPEICYSATHLAYRCANAIVFWKLGTEALIMALTIGQATGCSKRAATRLAVGHAKSDAPKEPLRDRIYCN